MLEPDIIKALNDKMGIYEPSEAMQTIKKAYDNGNINEDLLIKSWSKDLERKFPNGGWRTINGAKVFVSGAGKVVAGLDGFNKEIDKFFDNKNKEEKKTAESKKKKYKHVVHFADNTYTVIEDSERLSKKMLRKIAGNPSKIVDFTVADMSESKNNKNKESKPKPGTIDYTLDRLKESGYNKVITDKATGKTYLYNPKKNEKYPVAKKDYNKYKDKIHDVIEGGNADNKVDNSKNTEANTNNEKKFLDDVRKIEKKSLDSEETKSYSELKKISGMIDPKYLSSDTKSKINDIIEEVYVEAHVGDMEEHNKLYDSKDLKNTVSALETINKYLTKNEDSFVLEQDTFDKLSSIILNAAKEQVNKKTTERLNYKLF